MNKAHQWLALSAGLFGGSGLLDHGHHAKEEKDKEPSESQKLAMKRAEEKRDRRNKKRLQNAKNGG